MIIIKGEDGAIQLVGSNATIDSEEDEVTKTVTIYLTLHLPGEDIAYPLTTVRDQTTAKFIKDRIMDAFAEGATVIEVHSSGVDTWKKE